LKKYLLSLIFFSSLALVSIAQLEPIDTDRPDQTESVFLVPKHWVQFETGFTFSHITSDEREYLLPTLLSKYGISKNVEFRLLTTFISASNLVIPTGTIYENGFAPVEIGTKIALLQQKKLLPQTSLIIHLGIPHLASSKYNIKTIAPAIVLVMQNAISKNFALGYNFGVEWDGVDNSSPTYIYTLSPGLNFAKNWYSYIEAFGSFKKSESPQHNIDGGIAYYFSNNCKVDLSSGFGVTSAAPLWYFAVGFSVRFKT
jgi:hypothetical protein